MAWQLQHNRGDSRTGHVIVEGSDNQCRRLLFKSRTARKSRLGREQDITGNAALLIRNLIPICVLLVCLMLHGVSSSRWLRTSGRPMLLENSR